MNTGSATPKNEATARTSSQRQGSMPAGKGQVGILVSTEKDEPPVNDRVLC